MNLLNVLGLLGLVGIGFMLVILGLVSKRLGEATRAPRRYVGFFAAAALLFLSAVIQLINLVFGLATPQALGQSILWIFLYHGLPALGLSVGLYYAWRYWSWLLAEHD